VLVPILLALVAAGVLCVAYGAFIERRAYRVVRHRLDILPATGPEALTVLHVSDLHFIRDDAKKVRFLSSLPAADVTVVTGDFLAEPEAVETTVAAVRAIRGALASWFVLGSNDYYVPRAINPLSYFVETRGRRPRRRPVRGRWREMVAMLESDGWQDLTNVHREVDLGTLPIELLGLDDAHIWRHDLRMVPRTATERFGFAVMHSPDSAPEAAACGYDLIVAGHTHGGQIALPFVGPLVTNSVMPRRLAGGLMRLGGAWMSLSPGLGTSKFAPFRFLVPPEVTYLDLRRAQAPAEITSSKTRS
jgi:predicted MPP superfamily phosphohydrolase